MGRAEGRFLVDTGAAVSVLDEAFARRSGVAASRRETVTGPGGARLAWQGNPAAMQIVGGPTLTVSPSLLDLSPVARRMGGELCGLIGSDLLSHFIVALDYRTGRVRLLPAGALPPPASAAPMRVGRTPYVHATLVKTGVSKSVEFQLDTGANIALALFKTFAQTAFPAAQASAGAQIGVAGLTRTALGKIDALSIAGVQLLDLQADFADDLAPDDASRDYAGVIGGSAWRGRQIVLDYPGGRFWIE